MHCYREEYKNCVNRIVKSESGEHIPWRVRFDVFHISVDPDKQRGQVFNSEVNKQAFSHNLNVQVFFLEVQKSTAENLSVRSIQRMIVDQDDPQTGKVVDELENEANSGPDQMIGELIVRRVPHPVDEIAGEHHNTNQLAREKRTDEHVEVVWV